MFLASSHNQGGGSSLILLLLMLGLFGMYFLFLRAQSRRRKQIAEMQESLTVGTHVVTIGGLCGTVVGVRDDMVALEVDPGVTNTYLRGAVQRVLTAEEAARASLIPAAEDADDVDATAADEVSAADPSETADGSGRR